MVTAQAGRKHDKKRYAGVRALSRPRISSGPSLATKTIVAVAIGTVTTDRKLSTTNLKRNLRFFQIPDELMLPKRKHAVLSVCV